MKRTVWAVDGAMRCRRSDTVMVAELSWPSARRALELGLLFLLVCAFWGFVLYAAAVAALQ